MQHFFVHLSDVLRELVQPLKQASVEGDESALAQAPGPP